MSRKQKNLLDKKYSEFSTTGGARVTREELDRMMVKFQMEGRTVTTIGVTEIQKKIEQVASGRGRAS